MEGMGRAVSRDCLPRHQTTSINSKRYVSSCTPYTILVSWSLADTYIVGGI